MGDYNLCRSNGNKTFCLIPDTNFTKKKERMFTAKDAPRTKSAEDKKEKQKCRLKAKEEKKEEINHGKTRKITEVKGER